MPKSIGSLIRRSRLRAKIPADVAAKAARVDPAYYRRIESGQATRVPFEVIARIAESLGLSLDDLAAGRSARIGRDIPNRLLALRKLRAQLAGTLAEIDDILS